MRGLAHKLSLVIFFWVAAVLVLWPQPQAVTAGQDCGTFWTGWMDSPDADVNPCPKGCVRGERQIVNTYKQGDKMKYEARYQCNMVPPGRQTRAPSVRHQSLLPTATLTPASGPWHTFVRIKGKGVGSTSSVGVVWYPNDDDSQPPAGALTATLRNSFGADEIEIEIPSDSGIGSGGAIRVMLTLPGRPQPVYAGTFSVTGQTQVGVGQLAVPQPKPEPAGGIKEHPLEAFQPKAFTTEPIQLTGTRRPLFVAKVIATGPIQFTGTRHPPFIPVVITTEAIQLSGTRRPSFVPKVITTDPIQLTGTRVTPPSFKSDRPIKQPPVISRPIMPR